MKEKRSICLCVFNVVHLLEQSPDDTVLLGYKSSSLGNRITTFRCTAASPRILLEHLNL